MTSSEEKQNKRKLVSEYYNASQFRIDTWNKLKSTTHQLAAMDTPSEKLREKVRQLIEYLAPVEIYWAFPGPQIVEELIRDEKVADFKILARKVSRIATALLSGEYRRKHIKLDALTDQDIVESSSEDPGGYADFERARSRPYFEVLIVDSFNINKRESQREALRSMRRDEDRFTYSPVFVPSLDDALIAVSLNHNIQSVIIRFGFDLHSENDMPVLNRYIKRARSEDIEEADRSDYGSILADTLAHIRPELDLFLVTDQSVEEVAGTVGNTCRRVFYGSEDFFELHLNILRGIEDRYKTPFFTALKDYSAKPTGVFHALPISRGKSIIKSHWIQDMGEFYGLNIFLAETSSTSGGLDSLLEPHGPIKEAQELTARAFGSKQTFFATNGTSTCNKIVVQSLVKNGDIVLIDRDCHKSHHYGMVLAGANVVYLDSYPLSEYSMYGAVPLRSIKEKLLLLKKEGKLDRVKMLLLTNCTFDGIVYNVQRVMEECLAIKPDLVFLWDEAWFGFARFGPTYRQRTAMYSAGSLRRRLKSDTYAEEYAAFQETMATIDDDDIEAILDTRLYPDPNKARIRVYATQSTHKTLTALRQGSMIHIYDQDYKSKVEEPFHEAFMTHTSTSPNYQILASLDVGRRQVELEGFELVQKQVEMAMRLRQAIRSHPKLSKYFRVLTVGDMVPSKYRQSGIESYYEPEHGWPDIWDAWEGDEFCLDATRVTLFVGETGMDGDTFKNKILMDKYGIQINKTSRNTVLFMTNIGTTRSSVAYLIEVLVKVANEIELRLEDMSPAETKIHQYNVKSIVEDLPPLPDFSCFHEAFREDAAGEVAEGDSRSAFFLSYDADNCEYIRLDSPDLDKAIKEGRDVVSSSFVIPYPPGFPVLVPGQVVSMEIIEFLRKLDVKEIHGYRPELGLRIFTQAALEQETRKRGSGASL
ncbi:aminotransferase class I/II-fold pyridoxal phosphate-dependent enzyme [Kordiimonas sp. SCSIO 12610]|uniref:aminotransferase class I/II-fold pyridoxal phosphate-dependent enzyme n=1 Tax=Kordiimonas sp. SCSIO 12610 TaxID=2829597 RepID=UPI00210C3C1D|nr:aminotransferase class I/II-fold pyridoxal phosphate-dependent enzyme [Kordiimonas sp. SCSIO 12610]UTW54733.1 aminotransferase class I/II-fold pyridoxal phosphate-dependent enzyme [Kordiimonas sp. SCSIO 12610]